ncbi:MAG: DUF5024 domain-containing protein [Alistipes sp.]|nr:DUF5024 domain-containing protein [Alistipes sp.]
MKRLLIFAVSLIVAIAECSAQQSIDELLNREIDSGTTVFKMAVKRDPETGEIIKRVKEFTTTGNKQLAKEFVEAFESERDNVDGWEENRNGGVVQITAVWVNPKRIYTITVAGSALSVFTQTIYREEDKKSK